MATNNINPINNQAYKETEKVDFALFLKNLKEQEANNYKIGKRQFNAASDGSSEAFEINGIHFTKGDGKHVVTSVGFSQKVESDKPNWAKILANVKDGTYALYRFVDHPDRYRLQYAGEGDRIEGVSDSGSF